MKTPKSMSATLLIILGVLFILLKGGVISIAMTLIGVALIFLGIHDISKHTKNIGTTKIIVGVCIILFGWVLVSLACYVLAVILIVHGITQFRGISLYAHRSLAWIRPTASIAAGISLLFNYGGAIDWIFLVAGVLLVIDGALQFAD